MKSLLKNFKGLIKESIMGPLFKLLEATFELFVPLVIADLIDKGIKEGLGREYIITRVAVLLGLGVIGLVCSLTAQYFSAKAAVMFASRVRKGLFDKIQQFSFNEIDEIGTSTLITRMTSDVNILQSGVNMTLRLFLRSPFIVFGATIMAFTIDAKCSLIFLVVLLLLGIVVYGVMLLTMPGQKKVQSHLDNILGKVKDNLSGIKVIRAFRKENEEIEKFDTENNALMNRQFSTGRLSALTNPVTYVIINLGTAALIYQGALRVDMGTLTQGQVVALVNYMSQILVELIKLANFIVLDIKALASASRIEQVMLTNVSQKDGNDKCEKREEALSVVFEDVSFKYGNSGGFALENISFEAKPGETIGIIGGTGSGKSSLINLIPRYYDATCGRVLVGGKDVKEYEMESLRENISMTPQKAVLFSGTIRDNMRWGNPNATDEQIFEALDMAMAGDFVREKEGQLDYMISQKGKNLSGGQRQRLTIARALLVDGGVVVLDDSSSALDALTDKMLRENLKKNKTKHTLFIASQRTASIMEADKILVLDNGKLVGQGTHQELLENCQVYKEIYDSQFA